jgi:hypothetical protein
VSEGEEGDHTSFMTRKETADMERVSGAIDNMRKSSVTRKVDYDKKRLPVPFKVGDKVLSKTHFQSSSEKRFAAMLAPMWDGPFVVEKQVSPVNFAVRTSRGRLETKHVDQLKLWVE